MKWEHLNLDWRLTTMEVISMRGLQDPFRYRVYKGINGQFFGEGVWVGMKESRRRKKNQREKRKGLLPPILMGIP
jgi:hypothetical protein